MALRKPVRRPPWWRRIFGEISKLTTTVVTTGRAVAPYALNSATRVDYELARQLYKNTADDYKLGAAFARPIIDTTVGFMGVPRFRSVDEEAQAVLDDHFGRWVGRLQTVERDAFRDGDCFMRLVRIDTEDPALYPEVKGARLDLEILPPGQVSVEVDPTTGRVAAYIIRAKHLWGEGNRRNYTVTQRIARDAVRVTVEGDAPPGVTSSEAPNTWGFIPLVHVKNEAESDELYGSSDLEPVEPFMKAYHDVFMHAIQGSKMHSTPKLKLNVKDIAAFLERNFGVTEEQLKSGQTKLSLQGRELLLMADDEDASFIEVRSATGGAEALLEFLFYCIVDVSQTPEFVFGTAVASSKASVSEQMPALIRKVGRKREMMTEPFQLLARMVLAMVAAAENRSFQTYETTLEWDEVNPKDEKTTADTLQSVVQALVQAIDANLISLEAAVQYLKLFVPTMMDYLTDDPEQPGERERIIRTKILLARLEDPTGLAAEGDVEKAIQQAAGGNGGG